MEVWVGRDEAPHFALRRFLMEPGGGMPLHTNRVEHEQYVLKGSATVRIGDQDFAVAAGDAVFIPAGVPHAYHAGPDGFEFLCIVPNADDHIEILD
jgi:quercetin dioxygenase-like cupin family protein